jgi:hypothetical protein
MLSLIALTFGVDLTINVDPPGAAEKIFYLASLGATIFPTALPSPSPYGQINLACRTGWRYVEPMPTSSQTPDWTTIDQCQSAAHAIGAKWSLSISIGANAPLWLHERSSILLRGLPNRKTWRFSFFVVLLALISVSLCNPAFAATEKVLWNFGADGDGIDPSGGLVMDGNGNLYETTSGGGNPDADVSPTGTVFKLTPAGQESILR